MLLKRLFCKHEYINEFYYTVYSKYIKFYCKKCGKVKKRIPIEENKIYEIEDCRNKGWKLEDK